MHKLFPCLSREIESMCPKFGQGHGFGFGHVSLFAGGTYTPTKDFYQMGAVLHSLTVPIHLSLSVP